MTDWDLDGERPPEPRNSGGMLSGTGARSVDGLSGPAKSGYLDMRPGSGISGLAWLGIVAILVLVGIAVWQWIFH